MQQAACATGRTTPIDPGPRIDCGSRKLPARYQGCPKLPPLQTQGCRGRQGTAAQPGTLPERSWSYGTRAFHKPERTARIASRYCPFRRPGNQGNGERPPFRRSIVEGSRGSWNLTRSVLLKIRPPLSEQGDLIRVVDPLTAMPEAVPATVVYKSVWKSQHDSYRSKLGRGRCVPGLIRLFTRTTCHQRLSITTPRFR